MMKFNEIYEVFNSTRDGTRGVVRISRCSEEGIELEVDENEADSKSAVAGVTLTGDMIDELSRVLRRLSDLV
jgi:hypothetical protein